MKTLTTFTAVAALIAGISIASAQGSKQQNTLSSSGATSDNAAWCAKTKNQTLNCTFASMEACQKASSAQGADCVKNPKLSTTGSGTKNMQKK